MPSMKAIKNRIKSVENTRQSTKAMQLVATSKMKKAKERIEASSPFFNILYETLSGIAASSKDFTSPFTAGKKEGKVCHIVIAGDRGLAGGYNINLFKTINFNDGDIIVPIGKKVMEFFAKKDVSIYTDEYQVAADVSISDCISLAESLTKAFLEDDFASIDIYYTSFVNVLSQVPSSMEVLPVPNCCSETSRKKLIEYDPDPATVFEKIIPHYISGIIWGAVCDSIASELSARRTAMKNATDNAEEIIGNLSLTYNRARQAAITQEITEIVAGSQNG